MLKKLFYTWHLKARILKEIYQIMLLNTISLICFQIQNIPYRKIYYRITDIK